MLDNKYTKKSYTIKFYGWVDVFEDDYKDGRLEYVNYWSMPKKEIELETLDTIESKQLIKNAIIDFLNNEILFYDNKITPDKISEQISIIDNRVCTSQLVNSENFEPTKNEIESWKNSGLMLYNQDINISISINNIDIKETDLCDILEV